MQIGDWTIDATCDRIVRDADVRKLERRATEVLVHLASRAGEVVSKDELIGAVWNGNAVSDHSVAIVISDLRRALDDDPREARYIETIPKRGYRLIAPVTPSQPRAPVSRPTRSRRRLAAFAIAPVLALGAIAVATTRNDYSGPQELIVGDIRNDSGTPAGDRLAYALPELLVANLGQFPRGSLTRLRGTDDPGFAESVERAILTGRIVRDGAGLSAFVSLKRVENGRVLWSESYPINDANVASNARDMAGAAAVALGSDIRLPAAQPTVSPETQARYWEARRLAESRDEPGLRSARARLIEALRISPTYAAAHVALAGIYAHKSGEHLGLPRLDTFKAAEHHLAIAEQLARPNGETSVTRALLATFRDQDMDAAVRHARHAVQIDPSSANAWQSLAMVASIRGDDAQALKAIAAAIDIEPSRRDLRSDRVWMLFVAGKNADARAAAAAIRNPGTVMLMYRAMIESRRGDQDAAFGLWLERARKRGLDPSALEAAAALRRTHLRRAYSTLANAVAETDVYEENAVALAAMYRGAGEHRNAMRALSELRPNRDNWVWLWLDRIPELRTA